MISRSLKLTMLSWLIALAGCSDPDRKLIGKAVSPDGKFALALYHEVPGSIIDDRLVLTIAAPNAPFSATDSVAGISVARGLRAFWTASGRPVLFAHSMKGWVKSEPSRPHLLVCVGTKKECGNLDPLMSKIEVAAYKSAESS